MKVGSVQVTLAPKPSEPQEPVVLCRIDNIWSVQQPDGSVRGLYSGELRLATALQDVIEQFHNGKLHPGS